MHHARLGRRYAERRGVEGLDVCEQGRLAHVRPAGLPVVAAVHRIDVEAVEWDDSCRPGAC